MTPAFWRRSDHVASVAATDKVDVVIIGGGIVGAGIALDCASRGMSALLVDRSDFGSGTSSRSTKLLHGGIRYMPQFRFGLVREGLREQKVLQRTADYLYEPLEFVLPLYRSRGFGDVPRAFRHPRVIPFAMRAGLTFYDMLGGRGSGSRHRKISAEEVARRAPRLKTEGLRGGFVYADAQTDDVRLTVTVIKTAVGRFGATAVNWMEATGVDQTPNGRLVHLTDRMSGNAMSIEADVVVAATGAFNPPGAGPDTVDIQRSKGIHLVVGREDLGIGSDALVLPETEDGRVLYVLPWIDRAIVGTTDTPYDGDISHPVADSGDIEYLVQHLKDYMAIDDVDVISTWAGLRALATKDRGGTARVSRAHEIEEVAPGYIQVAGGKLSGYRVIAKEVARKVGKAIGNKTKSKTEHLTLVGSGATRADIMAAASQIHLDPAYAKRLYRRYGADAVEVIDLIRTQPHLGESLGDGHATAAEAVFAVRHETAATLMDVAHRRTHLTWVTKDHGRDAMPVLLTAVGDELGWDEETRQREAARFERALTDEGL